MAGIYGSPSPYGYGSASPWFNIGATYGSPWGTANGFLETPLGKIGANQQDAAYYGRMISPFAGGNDAFSRWVQSQQGRFLGGLDQARLSNPDLSITDYAPDLLNYSTFANQWRNLDPTQRGEQWGRFAPRTREQRW